MRVLAFTSLAALASAATLALALPAPSAPATSAAADAYEVDNVHSTVMFKVKHLGTSWFYGRFNEVKGTFTHDAAKPENSSVSITVAADSVDTRTAKLDGHIESADFLSVKEFPEITFVSKSAKESGKGLSITGDLTLRGVTKSITIEAEHVGESDLPQAGPRAGFWTSFEIKRSDFGVSYGLPDAVGDEVTLLVSLEGTKK